MWKFQNSACLSVVLWDTCDSSLVDVSEAFMVASYENFFFFFFFEGLYFQENFIWKTSILKTRTIKSLKEEEIPSGIGNWVEEYIRYCSEVDIQFLAIMYSDFHYASFNIKTIRVLVNYKAQKLASRNDSQN